MQTIPFYKFKNLPKRNTAAAGMCYAWAYALFGHHPFRDTKQVWLCHGIGTQTIPPFAVMGHAWLEEFENGAWWVRDGRFPNHLVPLERFYTIGKIDESSVRRYSWAQARQLAGSINSVGPWDARIKAAAHAKDAV